MISVTKSCSLSDKNWLFFFEKINSLHFRDKEQQNETIYLSAYSVVATAQFKLLSKTLALN